MLYLWNIDKYLKIYEILEKSFIEYYYKECKNISKVEKCVTTLVNLELINKINRMFLSNRF